MNTNKSILITPGLLGNFNTTISQVDFKWYESGIGTGIAFPHAADLRATIYNWHSSYEPVLLFGGVGTINGQSYFVAPYTDYVDVFSGITSYPSIQIYPISGRLYTNSLISKNDISINNITIGLGSFQVFTNTIIGNGAGEFLNSSGNVAIGYSALQGTATTIITSANNTVIGYQAGEYLNASNNVVIGTRALGGTSTNFIINDAGGGHNVVIGYQAGEGAYVSASIIVGFNAGQYLNAADFNTIIGHAAYTGTSSTSLTGTSNVVIGYQAGEFFNSSASVIIGFNAGAGNSNSFLSGYGNILIGASAGEYLNASNNIAIGQLALQGIGTSVLNGVCNVVLGNFAGQYINANNNVVIGHNAFSGGLGTNQYITGGNNVIIGYNANGNITGSYQIALGFEVTPTASNLGAWGGNTYATRTNLGVGTFTPVGSIHIETLVPYNLGLYIAGQIGQSSNLLQIDQTTLGNNYFTINGVGSVGILTAAPTQSLDINGGLRQRGPIYDINNVSGQNLGIVTQYLASYNGLGVSWMPVKRYIYYEFNSSIFIFPYDFNDGMSIIQYEIQRISVRVENPSLGFTTVNVSKYSGVGNFSTTYILNNNITVGGMVNEGFSTSNNFTGFGMTAKSNDKLSVYITGVTLPPVTVTLLAREI